MSRSSRLTGLNLARRVMGKRSKSTGRIGLLPLLSRRLRFEPLEDRRLLAALVGVDFGPNGSFTPPNWTQIGFVGGPGNDMGNRTNLIDERGAQTSIDLDVHTSYSGGAPGFDTGIDASTVPAYTTP